MISTAPELCLRPAAVFSRADPDCADGVDVLTTAGVSVGLHVGAAGEVFVGIVAEDADPALLDRHGRLAHLTVALPGEARIERSSRRSPSPSWWRRLGRRPNRTAGPDTAAGSLASAPWAKLRDLGDQVAQELERRAVAGLGGDLRAVCAARGWPAPARAEFRAGEDEGGRCWLPEGALVVGVDGSSRILLLGLEDGDDGFEAATAAGWLSAASEARRPAPGSLLVVEFAPAEVDFTVHGPASSFREGR
ncbi:hypothetical protein ABT095_14950 [Kitasatospora sp. NPDC002227]|uniref:hypothetical protein n=1 Tax=Kitasatospora sp. NPDC002227 TaxID=3154773 RepID=UPI00332A1523